MDKPLLMSSVVKGLRARVSKFLGLAMRTAAMYLCLLLLPIHGVNVYPQNWPLLWSLTKSLISSSASTVVNLSLVGQQPGGNWERAFHTCHRRSPSCPCAPPSCVSSSLPRLGRRRRTPGSHRLGGKPGLDGCVSR